MPLSQTRWPLLGALVLGGLAIALFWWVTLDDPRGEAVPATGGSYVEGVTQAPERMNPLFAGANQTDADVVALVFSGLVRLSADGTPEPDLAERWQITNNGQRYVFHLRQGVAWHDGEAFDADDVLYTFRAIADPGFTGDPALAQLMAGVVITARDAYTVEFQLEQTYAPFLAQLTVGILPAHLLGDLDAGQLLNAPFNMAPVGTGPYRFVSRDADGNVHLASHSTYYFGPPRIVDFELRVFRTTVDAVQALRESRIDGLFFTNDAALPDVAGLVDDGWRLHALAGAQYYMLYLDTSSPRFNDRDVRRALFQGLNRDALLADVASGAGSLSFTGAPEASWAHSGAEMPPFRPGDAAVALEQEGFFRASDGIRANTDNVRLAFKITTADGLQRGAIAANVAAQLRQLGVAAEVETVDAATFIDARLMTRDYEAALVLVDPGPDPDPYAFWHSTQIAPPGLNFAHYGDSAIDDAIERARQTTDVQRRKDLYAQFDGYFIAAMPSFPLFAPAYRYLQAARVRGYAPELVFTPASRFHDVHAWYVETRTERR